MSRDLVSIDQTVVKRIEEYDFPGNVRELENMIERAIVIGNGKEIRLKDLPLEKDIVSGSNDSLHELEKKYILQTLNKFNWNISRAARALKVDRVTLYNKIKKYKLKSPKQL
jgi:DNA-binding NtrC family response regulator